MGYKPEPVIWSCDSGQRIPCFDRCPLPITWQDHAVNQDLVLAGVWPPCCGKSLSLRAIFATIHVDHGKRVAWVSISMHACGSVPIVMVFRYHLMKQLCSFKNQ